MQRSSSEVRKSRAEVKEDLNKEMKAYLNPHERFANRMKASFTKSGAEGAGEGD